MLVRSGLNRTRQHFERLGGGFGSFGGDHLVDPPVANEPDGRVPVLPL